jgi:hypothetical protein
MQFLLIGVGEKKKTIRSNNNEEVDLFNFDGNHDAVRAVCVRQ